MFKYKDHINRPWLALWICFSRASDYIKWG